MSIEKIEDDFILEVLYHIYKHLRLEKNEVKVKPVTSMWVPDSDNTIPTYKYSEGELLFEDTGILKWNRNFTVTSVDTSKATIPLVRNLLQGMSVELHRFGSIYLGYPDPDPVRFSDKVKRFYEKSTEIKSDKYTFFSSRRDWGLDTDTISSAGLGVGMGTISGTINTASISEMYRSFYRDLANIDTGTTGINTYATTFDVNTGNWNSGGSGNTSRGAAVVQDDNSRNPFVAQASRNIAPRRGMEEMIRTGRIRR